MGGERAAFYQITPFSDTLWVCRKLIPVLRMRLGRRGCHIKPIKLLVRLKLAALSRIALMTRKLFWSDRCNDQLRSAISETSNNEPASSRAYGPTLCRQSDDATI
jgi:hypothetical protein